MSKEHADIIEKVANGDNRLYEIILGFDEGYLGDGTLYRLDVTPEAIIDEVLWGEFTIRKLGGD